MFLLMQFCESRVYKRWNNRLRIQVYYAGRITEAIALSRISPRIFNNRFPFLKAALSTPLITYLW